MATTPQEGHAMQPTVLKATVGLAAARDGSRHR